MEELKTTISKNITKYRKQCKLTQAELAEKINYSDKAVSKWECGDGIPDVVVLKQLADIFGVTVDALLSENATFNHTPEKKKISAKTKTNVTICSTLLVWLVATIAFVFTLLFAPTAPKMWLVFIWAIPVSCIVLTVFNGVWGKWLLFIPILSVLMWSLALALHLTIPFDNSYLFFILCIPLQVIEVIYFSLMKKK